MKIPSINIDNIIKDTEKLIEKGYKEGWGIYVLIGLFLVLIYIFFY